MRSFGPLLNLWEGGIIGEKIVSTMKPEIVSGLRKNWQIHLYRKMFRKYFFEIMQQKMSSAEKSNVCEDEDKITKKSVYLNKYEVEQLIHDNLPFVALYSKSSAKTFIHCQNEEVIIVTSAQLVKKLNGCCFHRISFQTGNDNTLIKEPQECLFLPFMKIFDNSIQINDDVINCYYAVTEDWLEFNEAFEPKLPFANNCYYDDELL
jgi:hypothetical protein